MAAPLDSTSEGLCLNTYLQLLQAEEDVDSKAAALNAARSELRQLEKRRKELQTDIEKLEREYSRSESTRDHYRRELDSRPAGKTAIEIFLSGAQIGNRYTNM
jgi:septal ring factor EnvC (AmiA/AmiB activator)